MKTKPKITKGDIFGDEVILNNFFPAKQVSAWRQCIKQHFEVCFTVCKTQLEAFIPPSPHTLFMHAHMHTQGVLTAGALQQSGEQGWTIAPQGGPHSPFLHGRKRNALFETYMATPC